MTIPDHLPQPWCTVAQAAAWLQVSPDTVSRLLGKRIRFVRVADTRLIRLLADDVLKILPAP